jgi:hypothetical protein
MVRVDIVDWLAACFCVLPPLLGRRRGRVARCGIALDGCTKADAKDGLIYTTHAAGHHFPLGGPFLAGFPGVAPRKQLRA